MSQQRPPAELVEAVYAQPWHSESWHAAVWRLGAWRRVEDAPKPKKPGRYTGRSQGDQFYTLTTSHVFDNDRERLRQQFDALASLPGCGTRRGELIAWAQAEIPRRKQAEKITHLAALAA